MTDDADSDEAVETDGETAESETTDENAPEEGSDSEREPVGDGGEDDGFVDGAADVADDSDDSDDTVPNVELSLYQLSVRVSGRSEDDLQTVEDSAKRLMDYLIDRAGELEERPEDRGLS